MSTTIDEKVVEMRFDNKQFESNVQTSLSTLDKLKQSLNLDDAAKGLENINTAAKNCDMSGLSGAVQTVQAKFSALEVIAITAISNITNSAISAGTQLIKSLSVDNIAAGWEKFGEKTQSVATLISQGYDLESVTEQLERLNWYTDETSYNFTDMVSNIAKFTASGQDLETSVTAMEGIANWAALSGQNASTASRAMYQLAQAMSAGYMRLEDYKSIQNASMDTAEFRQNCIDAAIALGTLKDNGDGTYSSLVDGASSTAFSLSSFTSKLTEGCWLTSDVMMSVFNTYSGAVDQIYEYAEEKGITASEAIEELGDSVDEFGLKAFKAAQEARTWSDVVDSVKDAVSTGWMNTFELIFGNYEEATQLWTDLANAMYDVFAEGGNVRNEILQEWKDLGGRDDLIESFWNAWEGVSSIITPIKEAFRDIFPQVTADQLYNITNTLKEFTSRLKLSDTASENLKSTFKGLFAILDIVKQAFSAVFNALTPLFGGVEDLGGSILTVTGRIGDWHVALDDFIKKNNVFTVAVEGITDVVTKAIDAIKEFIEKISEDFKMPGFELIHAILERVHERLSQVSEAAGDMKSGFVSAIEAIGEAFKNSSFLELLQTLWNAIKTIGGGVVDALGKLIENITSSISNADFSGIIDLLNGLSLGGIALTISQFLKTITDVADGFLSHIVGVLDSARDCFKSYQEQIKAETLLKIASAIAILTASIVAIALIDSEKLSASLGAITVMFADLLAATAVFNKLGGVTGKGTTKLIAFAAAILILAIAVKKLANLSWEELATGLVGVGVLLAEVDAFMATAKFSNGTMSTAAGILIFAAAIKVLASAVKDLAELDWNQLTKGLVGIGVLLAEVDVFLNTAKLSGKTTATAIGVVILAAAIKVLASACKDFGEMKWSEIAKGLTSIGALLAEVTAFTKLTGNAKNVISTGLALIEISAAMKIFASAMDDFAKFSWEQIAKGLISMGVALVEIAAATKLMPKNIVTIGTGLVVVGAALEIIANVLGTMGEFSWEQIAKGLVTLGVAMAELAIGLNFMNGTLSGSAALLIAAAALAVLTPVLSTLGAMSLESIVKGLGTIAGVFTIFGIAAAVLSPLVPTILSLSAALALIGVSALAVGVGLLAAATGFTALATAGAAGATAIVAALTVVITGIAALIPAIIEKVGEAIVALCNAITDSLPAIGEAIKAIVLTLVDVLVECVPTIAEGVLELVAGVLDALVEYTPQIVESIFQFLIKLIEGIANNLPELIKAVIDLLMSFFSGIVDTLKGIDTEALLEGIVGIGLLSAIMVALSAMVSLTPGAMVGVLAMGAVIAELALVLAAIGVLAQIPGLSWLIGEGGTLLQGIGTAIGSFIGGIVGGFMGGVSSQFGQIGSDLSAFMTNIGPFLEGASLIQPSMMEGVSALAETILILTAADILQGLTSFITGGSSLADFGEQLVPFGTAMREFSQEIADINPDVVANAATAGKALAEMATTIPNSGGVVGFFAGENDMDKFGEQLVPFGTAMMSFSQTVAGLNPDVVTNAATAGKALIELANTVPNSGGVVGFFTGENDMGKFGEQLVPFGEAMKKYSDAVSGIEADAISNSTVAGKALVELANTIPNTGGVVSWFTGDNNMATFGDNLVTFGNGIKKYSEAVADIETGQLSKVITQVNRLVDMASGMAELDTSGMNGFSSALKTLAKSGIDDFVNEFNNAGTQITTAAGTLVTTFSSAITNKQTTTTNTFKTLVQAIVTAIKNKQSEFKTVGATLMTSFIGGVNTKSSSTKTTFTTIITNCVTAIRNRQTDFKSAATTLMSNLVSGLNSKKTDAANASSQIASSAAGSARSYYYTFYSAGQYLVTGFANGITANTYLAQAKSRAMANAAATSARKALNEHSPSKVGYEIGDYFGVAFVNAIGNYEEKSYEAGTGIAESARNGLSNAVAKISEYIDSDMDASPTIRPVLDLTNVSDGIQTMSQMFGSGYSFNLASRNNATVNTTATAGSGASSNNNDVVDAITKLQNEVSSLSSVVGNLKVVMDTGSLVGALTGPLDISLGKQATYVKRGI